jgi:hypothetical protein
LYIALALALELALALAPALAPGMPYVVFRAHVYVVVELGRVTRTGSFYL